MTHQARKRFGQNFLKDQSVISNILAHAMPKAGQHWVEIGPGLGALTEPLLQKSVTLDLIELDRDLVAYLRQKFKDHPHLNLHSADALAFDFRSLVGSSEKLHIIGNLPYNISTPLMFHLLESGEIIDEMHFMLQKEVVDRICAEPGNKNYGRLSVMMQYHCETESLFDVPPECFDPIPKVQSAIVRLKPHSQPPVAIHNLEHFSHVVSKAFSQRRKTIRNTLKDLISEEQMLAIGINPNLRAENLSLEQFASIERHSHQPEFG